MDSISGGWKLSGPLIYNQITEIIKEIDWKKESRESEQKPNAGKSRLDGEETEDKERETCYL